MFDDWQLLEHEQSASLLCFMCTADVLKSSVYCATACLPMLIHPRTITQPRPYVSAQPATYECTLHPMGVSFLFRRRMHLGLHIHFETEGQYESTESLVR